MTRVRRCAVKIAAFVERYASPGSKEWAEASARELDFVKSDWAALGWALGSVRVLLDHRPVPLKSLTEVPSAAQKFVEYVRSGPPAICMALLGPSEALWFFSPGMNHWQVRAAVGAAILGSALCLALWLIERRRLKDPASDAIYDDDRACALFYRRELERYKFTMWAPSYAWYAYTFAFCVKNWSWLSGDPMLSTPFVMFCIVFAWLQWQVWHNSERRLEQLDLLLAKEA